MKKLTNKISLYLTLCILISCSSEDDTNNSISSEYAKKWYVGDEFITINDSPCENSYYDLRNDGSIEYRYIVFGVTCEHDIENGEWYVEDDFLVRFFPSDPGTNNEITLENEIISVSETELILKRPDGILLTYYNYD